MRLLRPPSLCRAYPRRVIPVTSHARPRALP
jgi:hypothetical protein